MLASRTTCRIFNLSIYSIKKIQVSRNNSCISSLLLCTKRYNSTSSGTNGINEENKLKSESSPLSAKEFASITPMILLRQALKQHVEFNNSEINEGGRDVISRAVFNHYCRESHISNSDEALRLLEEAGIIISISNGEMIHLKPVQFLRMYEELNNNNNKEMNNSLNFFLEEANKRLAAAEAEEIEMRKFLKPALEKTVKWRHFIWSSALCFAGLQLAIISRLTFFDLNWDIMEPITYFIGTGTSLVFFFYFIRYGRSHTYDDYDRTMLPKKVKQYASRDFNWEKYSSVCKKIDDERKMIENIREWVKRN